MLVALFTEKLSAGVPPKVTEVAPVKFVPERVTLVPPVMLPVGGETFVMLGAGSKPV